MCGGSTTQSQGGMAGWLDGRRAERLEAFVEAVLACRERMGDGGWGGGAASGVGNEWGERQASKTREERGGGMAPMGMQTVCWATKLLGQLG